MYQTLFILSTFIFLYGLVAKRIEIMTISGPIIFLAFGLIAGPSGIGMLDIKTNEELISVLAELTLALVLFTDASQVKAKGVKLDFALPKRLLLFGLPLTIVLGFVAGYLLFGHFSIIEVAILAVILAPTDAALGKAVVSNPKVPARIRDCLNVESGLNDGICVPFLLLCFAFLNETGTGQGVGKFASLLFIQEIGIGAGVGMGLTFIAHFVITKSDSKGWISDSWQKMLIIMLSFSIFSLAQFLGGSGFIACFAGGILYGILDERHKEEFVSAAEGVGDSLAIATWVLFGAGFFVVVKEFDFNIILYSVLSLTVIRMLPVFLVLIGTDIKSDGKLFIGWFGPRGLATIVFAVMVNEKDLANGHAIILTVVCTIVLSILAHGFSANPLANWLGKRTTASLS